MTTAD